MGFSGRLKNGDKAANSHESTQMHAGFLICVYSRSFAALLLSALWLNAQTVCGPTAVYSPCEIVFELTQAESAAHPNPYKTVELRAEFRSPRHRTFLMPA